MGNNDSAYGGLFIIAAVLGVLLLVCGGGAFFFIFSAKSVSTSVTTAAMPAGKSWTSLQPLPDVATVNFLKANGPIQLSKDNSLTEHFVKAHGLTPEQHEHFKTVVTKYRKEIDEIASPKSAYSLNENNWLKIEISPFETDGSEIEKDLREELLEQLNEDQLSTLQTNVNFEEPFYGFGQYTIEIEFGPTDSVEGYFTYNKKMTRDNDTNSYKLGRKLEDNPSWQAYEDKRQELLKK